MPWGRQLWLGLLLLGVFWPLNWALPGMRTAYLFFPLWLGYILAVDGLVLNRTGTSLWNRSRFEFGLLFVVSAPVWWLFEMINRRTANWQYVGSDSLSGFQYVLLCSISFSTVMPAVFETAELARSFRWVERFGNGPRIPATAPFKLSLFLAGAAMLGLTLRWPKYCYPFVWSSVVLLLEPLNAWLGRSLLLPRLERGDWRPVISLSAGALVCGFFWEMWNYYSLPKWIYHTPGAQFLHVFEMPLLGYGGYVPFALELYALKTLLCPHWAQLKL